MKTRGSAVYYLPTRTYHYSVSEEKDSDGVESSVRVLFVVSDKASLRRKKYSGFPKKDRVPRALHLGSFWELLYIRKK
nr:MAG TPA: hypothetical protein [Caudoviricetes sp.]